MAVTVYSKPGCGYCTAVKHYLKDHGIRFRDFDVSRDAAAAAEMKRRSGQTAVPVIDVNGRIVVGFDKRRQTRILGIRAEWPGPPPGIAVSWRANWLI